MSLHPGARCKIRTEKCRVSRQREQETWNIGLYYIDRTVNGLIFGGIYALTPAGEVARGRG